MGMPAVTVDIAFGSDPGETPVWTDVSSRLIRFDVNRGRSSELDRFMAGRATVVLSNEDRVLDPSFGPSAQYVDLPNISGNYVSTPAQAGFALSANSEIRWEGSLDSFVSGGASDQQYLVSNYSHLVSGFKLYVSGAVTDIRFQVSTAGSAPSMSAAHSLAAGSRVRIKVVRTYATGSTQLYAGPATTDWAALPAIGAPAVLLAGVTIPAGTAVLRMGGGENRSFDGQVVAASVIVGGATIAGFDANAQPALTTRTPTTVTGAAGETWTLNGANWVWGGVGTWAPYWPNVVPMRRIRIRATYAAVTYDVYTGFVDSWEQQYAPPQGAVAVVHATDAFKVLSAAEMLSSAYAEMVDEDGPVIWWRLGEAGGAVTAVESVTGDYPLEAVGEPVFGVESLSVYDPDGAVQFTDPSSTTVSQAGLQGVFPEGTFPFATAGSIELLYRRDGTHTFGPRVAAATPFSAVPTGIETVDNPTNLEFWLYNTAGATFNVTTTGVSVGDGQPHHVVVTWAAGSPIKIWVDAVDRTSAVVNFTGTMANTTDKWIALANAADYPPIIYSGYLATFDEYAFYDYALSGAQIAAHYATVGAPWVGDRTGERVERVLDAVEWPAADRDVATGVSILGPANIGGSVLSNLQKIEESEQGAMFVAADGKVTFLGRDDILSAASQGTFGDSGAELEYADLIYVFDDQMIFNDVQVSREGGVVQVVGDTDSQARYLRRSKVFSGMLYQTDTEARALAGWWIMHYREPLLRATNMHLEPSAGNEATHFPHVLGRELLDRVTVKRRPQNFGSAINQDALIEGITHSVSAVEWRTTWNLSPADTGVYWLAEVAGAGEAGVTTRAAF